MTLTVCEPYTPREDSEIKFETYRFYLQCICDYLREKYTNWKTFGRECFRHTQTLKGMRSFDEHWIERFMKISWNTEYLLSANAGDPELMRINNQWTPIQCYYTVYAACEAVAYALDSQKANGHHKTLRKVSDYFVRSGLSPWDKAFKEARGKKGNEHKPVNFPEHITIPSNLQRRNVVPIQMIAKCLKAEHSHRIDDLWQRRCGIYKYQFDPGYTSLLHFLYRLRIKSNYKEVDLFVTEAPEENIRSFSRSIGFLTFWTLLYAESIIIRKCRKRYLIGAAEKYLTINQKADRLEKRIDFYRKNV